MHESRPITPMKLGMTSWRSEELQALLCRCRLDPARCRLPSVTSLSHRKRSYPRNTAISTTSMVEKQALAPGQPPYLLSQPQLPVDLPWRPPKPFSLLRCTLTTSGSSTRRRHGLRRAALGIRRKAKSYFRSSALNLDRLNRCLRSSNMVIASSTVVEKLRTAVLGFQREILKRRATWLGTRRTRMVESHTGDTIEVSKYTIMSDLQVSAIDTRAIVRG